MTAGVNRRLFDPLRPAAKRIIFRCRNAWSLQAPCGRQAAGALTAAGHPPASAPRKRQQEAAVRSKLAAKHISHGN